MAHGVYLQTHPTPMIYLQKDKKKTGIEPMPHALYKFEIPPFVDPEKLCLKKLHY